LSANTQNWGIYYIDEVRKVMEGSWSGARQTRSGIKEGVVVLAPLNSSVPSDVASMFESKKQAIMAGTLVPFAGPLKDNTGVLKVPANTAVSIDDLMQLNWFVEGVDATVPK
jgi:simple sugar transport system substrate-binding protein